MLEWVRDNVPEALLLVCLAAVFGCACLYAGALWLLPRKD
jgi:membrane protein DedA with SNARE-associated domain